MPDDALRADGELAYLVRSLRCGVSVLYVCAHPDDEEGGLIALLAHGHGARVVLWSATRGEGGQNFVTPYVGRELGIYRTWESLAARAIDGAESLFGPFYDFGYSKNGAEALEKWGREALVRELVRAIRAVQPQIVISCWRGDATHGHGHHQAVGIAIREAFARAADAAGFPELEAVGLAPWQPRKLYVSMKREWQPGEDIELGVLRPDLDAQGCLRVNVGEFDPIAGLTFQQQGALSLNSHLSQGTSVLPAPGDHYLYLRLDDVAPDAGLEGRNEIFDGIEDGLTTLADHPGGGDPALRAELEQMTGLASQAAAELRADAPWAVASTILELAERWARLEADAPQALASAAERRREAAEVAAAACLGLRLSATVDRPSYTPGDAMQINARLRSYGPEQPTSVEFEPLLDLDGADVRRLEAAPAAALFEVRIPESAPLSCPYWLRTEPGQYAYNWPTEVQAGTPFGEPLVAVRCTVEIAGRTLRLVRPALYEETFKGGYRELRPGILPPVSVQPRSRRQFVAARPSSQALDVGVALVGHRAAPDARFQIAAPEGWPADPDGVAVPMRKPGDADAIAVTVTVPPGAPPGRHQIRYGVDCDGRLYEASLAVVMQTAAGLGGDPDEGTCIRREYIVDPSVIDINVIDVAVHEPHRHAYITGVRDDVPRILRGLGLRVDELDDHALAHAALGTYDTIVVGPQAFVVRQAARTAARRLLAYTNEGGTLLVQHQGYAHENMDAAPAWFRYRQPHDRITLETAPVRILQPEHYALRFPNHIVPADFDGWLADRGLYFFGEWSDDYDALLACADPGEEEKTGGLLIAGHGRGTYVYCGYSLFRQLAAGVPGAFRLFANLLALPEARIQGRMEHLRSVPVFSRLDDAQLRRVASIARERRLADGEYLAHEGEEGAELYLVDVGALDVLQGDRHLRTCVRGEPIGELAALTGHVRTASLRASGDTRLLAIRSVDFLDLLRSDADIAAQVVQLLASRLYGAMTQSQPTG
jgi:LmbE family N-acetylglucosaminyl deacetylase